MREPHAICSKLSDEQTEWEIARDYVRGFSETAKVVQIGALDSVIGPGLGGVRIQALCY